MKTPLYWFAISTSASKFRNNLAASPVEASDPFLAQVIMFAGNFAPRGWAYCDGALMAINQNQSVFALLGTTYGGDGRTTFGLPDLRGRVPIGPRQGPGLSSYNQGQKGGAETAPLSAAQMPSHTHTATATVHATSTNGNQTGPTAHVPANDPREDQFSDGTPDVTMNGAMVTVSNANTGGGGTHANVQPYLAINFIIALSGTFPSRN
jgi:microcystin-dependent protein